MLQREQKLWGERWLLRTSSTNALSFLKISKGHRCSRHSHTAKYNLFFVITGRLGILTDEGETILEAEDHLLIPPGVVHEFRAYDDTLAIEDMFVEYHEEDIDREDAGGDFELP